MLKLRRRCAYRRPVTNAVLHEWQFAVYRGILLQCTVRPSAVATSVRDIVHRTRAAP